MKTFTRPSSRWTLAIGLAACLVAVPSWAQKGDGQKGEESGPVTIGEILYESAGSPAITAEEANQGEAPVWSTVLSVPDASYIAPHFGNINLPDEAWLVVRGPESEREYDSVRRVTYTGNGQDMPQGERGFWGTYIPGSKAVVELYSRVPLDRDVVLIDYYAWGFPDDGSGGEEAICGADDTKNAKCYQSSEPQIYDKSRAVLRLMIGGTGACTGWLVGNEGHVMTNNHCISTASQAANTNYEIMAEGSSCSSNCTSWGACPGTVIATSATLVKTNYNLDYTLLKLPVNPTSTYGFLQMRSSGPTVDERIYVPQHPQAWGKRIAVTSDHWSDGSGYTEIYSVTEPGCGSRPGPDVGYYADTQGGSSGSPVLGYDDHLVVALHHCANCPNRGVPIDDVIADLGSQVPAGAVVSGCQDPCPNGGVYDGANCYMWSVPGNDPFIWNGGLYYKPVWHPGGSCPHAGEDNWNQVSYPANYDGANCYLGHFGPNPFIWGGNYYLAAACQNCANPCPYAGTFDGANCYLFSWPGVEEFVWSNNWYYKPVWHPNGPCPHKVYNNWTNQWVQPWYDGANCYVGSASAGQTAFVWGNNYYQTPVCTP